jgi:chromosome segregation ATPase
MTDSQKLDLILSEVIGMKGDVAVLKEDMAVLKEDVAVLKEDVAILKEDVAVLKEDVAVLKEKVSVLEQRVDNIEQRVTGIEVHLENQTDKNIQLIAENFIELTNKLNQAIPVADKNLAYEVKVNYLIEKVQFLEKDFQEFKYQMAYS